MRYKLLAHHLVHRLFPGLNKKTQNEIVSEAVCRAWCTFQVPDYRLMEACVEAAARRKGLLPPEAVQPPDDRPSERMPSSKPMPNRANVIRMADYR